MTDDTKTATTIYADMPLTNNRESLTVETDWHEDDDDDYSQHIVSLAWSGGNFNGWVDMSAETARQLATALLAHADLAERRNRGD